MHIFGKYILVNIDKAYYVCELYSYCCVLDGMETRTATYPICGHS